jgi:hypothetical protein
MIRLRKRRTTGQGITGYFWIMDIKFRHLHPEIYTAKNYKRREKTKERKATVLNSTKTKRSSI